MKAFVVAAALLFTTSALAQDASKRVFDLKFTGEHVEIIWRALQDRPFKESAPVIGEIQKQIAEQTKLEAPKPAEPEK